MPSRAAAVSRPGKLTLRDWLEGYRQGEPLTHLTASGRLKTLHVLGRFYPSWEASSLYKLGWLFKIIGISGVFPVHVGVALLGATFCAFP